MQCVILAAGEGQRMRPLTETRPKQLVEVLGRPIIDHIADLLPEEIDEIIMVIGYRGKQIRDFCGTQFHGRKVTYIEQNQVGGTAKALRLCKPFLKDRFLLLLGDDLHDSRDLETAIQTDSCVLVSESDNPERFGVVSLTDSGHLAQIIEKPEKPLTNLVSTGVMVLDPRIFNYESRAAENGEHYIPTMLEGFAKDHPVSVVRQKTWIPIGYPEDVQKAEKILAESLKLYA